MAGPKPELTQLAAELEVISSPSSLLVHTRVRMCTSKRAHTARAHVKAKSEGSGRASSNVGRPNGVGTLDRDARGGFDT